MSSETLLKFTKKAYHITFITFFKIFVTQIIAE